MNFVKAQKQVIDSLLKGYRCVRLNIDEKHIFVTPDGYRGYVFPVSTIVFGLEKISEMTTFSISEIIQDENELKLTPDLRIMNEYRKEMCRRLKGKNGNVFVNVKFLECYQNPKFYQGDNPLGIVVVAEGAKGAYTPVGIILPIRANWDTE
ncbi:hypothetical protein [Anaerotignum sp.]